MKAAEEALVRVTALRSSLRAALEAAKRKRKAMEETAKRAGERKPHRTDDRPPATGERPAILDDPMLLYRILNGGG